MWMPQNFDYGYKQSDRLTSEKQSIHIKSTFDWERISNSVVEASPYSNQKLILDPVLDSGPSSYKSFCIFYFYFKNDFSVLIFNSIVLSEICFSYLYFSLK